MTISNSNIKNSGTTEHKLESCALLAYALFALPLAFIGLPIYIHAPDFYAVSYGAPLGIIGAALIVIRMIDAVQDPLIGHYIDRFSAAARQKLFIGALLGLCIGFAGLFTLPSFIFNGQGADNPWLITAWFLVALLTTTTAFSILQIGYHAHASLWTKNPHQKTKLTASREAFSLTGLVLAAMIPSILFLSYSADQAMQFFGFIFVVLLSVCAFIYKRYATNANNAFQDVQSLSKNSFKNIFKSYFESLRSHHYFYGIYALSLLASSFPAVSVIFFVRDYLGAFDYLGFFLALYFISGAALLPFWSYLSKIYGKEQSWLLAMIISIFAFIGVIFLEAGDITLYAVICFASGAALGAELALPPSILSDKIDQNQQQQRTHTMFSALTFLSKASFALASGIIFIGLELGGFMPSVDNTQQSLNILLLLYAIIPCLIKAVAALSLGTVLYHQYKAKTVSNI